MCLQFWGYPPIIFYQLFPHFWLRLFPGPISIGIDTLWAQLLLEFSTNSFETMHICSTWSEDVCVVLGLSSHYMDLKLTTFYLQNHDVGGLAHNGFLLAMEMSCVLFCRKPLIAKEHDAKSHHFFLMSVLVSWALDCVFCIRYVTRRYNSMCYSEFCQTMAEGWENLKESESK